MDRNGHGQWDAGAIVTMRPASTTGWRPSCDHWEPDGFVEDDEGRRTPTWSDNYPKVPATCLDPFGGSGTTARVANRLSRRAVLIDLNPDYLRQQLERNRDMPLGLGAA
jgi:hypothetical protein